MAVTVVTRRACSAPRHVLPASTRRDLLVVQALDRETAEEALAAFRDRQNAPMTPETEIVVLAALFFAAALLYSSVGHAGASAYLAAMALVGVAPATMRPTALVLNLFVAAIVIVRFSRAGHLPWRNLVPLAIGSVPMAFLGGSIDLPGEIYRPLVALVLLAGAWRLFTANAPTDDDERPGVPIRGRCGRRRHDRPAGRPDGNRGRHLPHTPARAGGVDRNPRCGRPVGRVHPRQLDRRTGRPADRRRQPPSRHPAVGRHRSWPAGSSAPGWERPDSASSTCAARWRSSWSWRPQSWCFCPDRGRRMGR